MKQIFESLASLKIRISNLFYLQTNSNNKVEYHFHLSVNSRGKSKKLKSKN